MGKSSSSFGKKRRSKYSSQGRGRKKCKIRRSKSKKLRRRYDSVSYSDDDSSCSLSISSSDSEDSYRSRRSRSRSQKDFRGSKKRSRTRSSSSEESPRVRKQKGTKRYHDRKKTHEKTKKRMKKKVRRDTSINSGSSDSLSCSSCQSSSSDSDVSEYEMRKGRSERRKDEDGELKIHNWKAYEPDMMNEMVGEDTSKRLRSVITFAREDNEGRELEKDKHKEEITYDHHDYPSSRSNDSNEGLNSRESAHRLLVASEKERPSDDKKEDDIASNIKTTEPKETELEGECQHARNKPGYDRVAMNDTKKKNNEVPRVADGSVKGDDLETILRQKALENLRRFRRGPGGVQTNVKSAPIHKDNVDGDVMAPSLARSELTQIKSTKDDDARGVKEDSPHSLLNENLTDGGNHGNEPVSAKNNVRMPDQVAIPVREKVSPVASSRKDKPRFITSALREALSNVTTLKETPAPGEANQSKVTSGTSVGKSATLKETPAPGEANQSKVTSGTSVGKSATPKGTPALQKSNQAKLVSESSVSKGAVIKTPGSWEANKPLVTGGSVGMSATHNVHTVTLPKGCDGDDKVNNAFAPAPSEPSSCIASVAGDISLNKSQGEGKEDSQFEQKTMSVLRGGETVQVSYKVYIPKKSPALSRRQLKR